MSGAPSFYDLIGLLRSLGSQLHHQEHDRVTADHKDPGDSDIPPPGRHLGDVDRPQVVRSTSVRTYLTSARRIRVEEVGTGVVLGQESLQVGSTGLTRGRVKVGQFVRSAVDGLVPEDKPQDGAHDVGKDVQIIEPVPPELRNGGVGDEHPAEG